MWFVSHPFSFRPPPPPPPPFFFFFPNSTQFCPLNTILSIEYDFFHSIRICPFNTILFNSIPFCQFNTILSIQHDFVHLIPFCPFNYMSFLITLCLSTQSLLCGKPLYYSSTKEDVSEGDELLAPCGPDFCRHEGVWESCTVTVAKPCCWFSRPFAVCIQERDRSGRCCFA